VVLLKRKKDGLDKETDLLMKERNFLSYRVCFQYLQKLSVYFSESNCLCWMNLRGNLHFVTFILP